MFVYEAKTALKQHDNNLVPKEFFQACLAYLDPVMMVIEELASSEGIHHWILGILDNIMCRNGWKVRSSLCKNAPFEPDNVIFGQQVVGIRNVTSQASLIESVSNVSLNLVNGVFETFGNGMTSQ